MDLRAAQIYTNLRRRRPVIPPQLREEAVLSRDDQRDGGAGAGWGGPAGDVSEQSSHMRARARYKAPRFRIR